MPVMEDTLASHLSPSLAPSWKSRPLLPSKPCRTTSALIGKSYIAAGQAGMALHTMAILQAYLLSSNSCQGEQGTIQLPPPLCLGSSRSPEGSPLAAEPRPRALPPLRFGEPVAGLLPTNNHASGVNLKRPNKPAASANPGRSWPPGRNEERRFTITGRGQTAEAFLPAPNALSSLKSVTPTLRGLVCRSNSPSFLLGLAVGGRVRLSPFAARPFTAGEPHVRRHSCFSPAVYGTRAGHPSAQHFSLHHPEQGRRELSFTVEGAAASRPSRHPISGMSSLTRHSDSSVALPSRMGASTRGIGSRRETGLSPSTWRMRIFTSRSFKDIGDSFGSPLEGRLTNTRSCPSAWLWLRGHLPNAWMLHWPLWGSRAFVYWTIWTTGSFWLTPGS